MEIVFLAYFQRRPSGTCRAGILGNHHPPTLNFYNVLVLRSAFILATLTQKERFR